MSEIINNVSRVPDSSIDYYKAYRSKNFYKGTSFRFLGEWTLGEHYFNDEYLIDFVSYKGALLACKKSHIATVSNIPDLIIDEGKEVTGVTSEVWNYAFSSLPAPEVTIDSVITGEPGSNANVEDVGEKPDVALKFTIPSGLSGAYAIHVGPESPIDFKNAHLDNKNIQAAYKYAEDMMWVDTTESSNNQAIQAVYTAFMQSGGTGTIDSFKSALKELINIKNKVSNIEEGATKTIVVDNITTDSSTSALSARQGVVLDNKITSTRNDLLSEMKDPASLADSLIYHKGDTVYDKNDVKLNPITEASKVATSADTAYNTQELLNIHVVDKLEQHDDAVITLTNNKVNNAQIVQGLGSSTTNIPSQKALTEELDKKLDISAPTVNETVIKTKISSEADIVSIMTGLTLLSTVEEAHQFFTNIALGYKPVLELYEPNGVTLYSRTPLFLCNDSYCCIASPFGQYIVIRSSEDTGADVTSINTSAFHSTTISVDISAEGTPTFNAGMFGLTGTELINQFSYSVYYGAFSPTLAINSQSTKYHSNLVPLYDASFDDDGPLTLRFALLNYDNYNIDMLQLVALSTGEVTVSFVNWVASNASQVVTLAGGNGSYQTQEQLNTSVLTSLASKANISGSAEQVFNVATPVSDTNAATKAYVDSAIMGNVVEDLTSTSITLTPVENTTYKYGTLSSLTLSSIPNSSNPTFIYFTSGATATTLSYPAATPTMGYMIPAANTSYMLSILNGKLILTSVSNG